MLKASYPVHFVHGFFIFVRSIERHISPSVRYIVCCSFIVCLFPNKQCSLCPFFVFLFSASTGSRPPVLLHGAVPQRFVCHTRQALSAGWSLMKVATDRIVRCCRPPGCPETATWNRLPCSLSFRFFRGDIQGCCRPSLLAFVQSPWFSICLFRSARNGLVWFFFS